MRDTPFERRNHDATPKHQGNLKRFLRDLHRNNQKEEREKQRAKDEVARLNGTGGQNAPPNPAPGSKPAAPSDATPEERKKQMAQLAAMGVVVPEEYRQEVAMAGEWQTVSQRVIRGAEEESKDKKWEGLNIGVRKRKPEGEDGDGEEDKGRKKKIHWGTDTKSFSTGDDADLDALLSGSTFKKRNVENSTDGEKVKEEPSVKKEEDNPPIKKEEAESTDIKISPHEEVPADTVKEEEEPEDISGIFKKRKPKAMRQK